MSATEIKNPAEMQEHMTLDEKVDACLAALSEIRGMMEYVPEISEKMEELQQGQSEILEKLANLGLDADGYSIERYDS